jgi:hypothetical protein
MTIEKKCFIKPEDIVAVSFQCKVCKSTTTIPIQKLTNSNVQSLLMKNCPHCQAESSFSMGTTELEHFIRFNVTLTRLAELLQGRNIEYGFEIKHEGYGE